MEVYNIFTDGSGDNKIQNGAYAFIILDEDDNLLFEESFYSNPSKSGREEVKALHAVVKHLYEEINTLSKDIKFTIYSDAQYVVNTVNNSWMDNWAMTDFFGRINEDLWREIYVKYRKLEKVTNISIKWCKGHREIDEQKSTLDKWTCKWNNHVDELAGRTRKKFML